MTWEGLFPIQGDVIVIEDDPIVRTLMTEMLAEIKAKSFSFPTADDALTHLLYAHGNCVLVIVDYGLPGRIQGADFIKMVKGKWPSIASILTSGYLIEDEMVPPSTLYLAKPWAMDDLVLAVANVLQPGYPIHKSPAPT